MKVLGILAFSDNHGGGVHQYTQSIIDALKEDKTREYVIFCNSLDNNFDHYGVEVRRIVRPKITIFAKIVRAFQLLLFIQKSWFFTNEELDNFSDIDIFLSPSISAYPHFYMNKLFIFTLHDMQERYYPEFFSRYERFMRWLIKRTLARSANKIICESIFVKNDIVEFIGIDIDKISIIQSPPPENFLNYKFESVQFEKVKVKYDLPEKFIFYPAQCWYHKNHINLVLAFQILCNKYDDIHLVLTGSQQNNYSNLISQINSLSLSHKVKHLGFLDYEDLPYLYKMSQFLVMPTLFESVSIPIYEAFALEVSVCSSNVTALPEQVGAAGVFFDPHNINDMAEKMMLYIENEDLRRDKAKLGFDKVNGFNHQFYRARLMEILDAY